MTSMPRTHVVDGARNVRPEWREYLGMIEASIGVLQRLSLDAGVIEAVERLKARLKAIEARIAALPDVAVDPHEHIVVWRGLLNDTGNEVTINHGLGTRHVFWQLRDINTGLIAGETYNMRVAFDNEAAIRLHLANSGTWDATVYGVISDRY